MNVYDFGWSDEITNEKINIESLARIIEVHKTVCRGISSYGEINIYLSRRQQGDRRFRLVTGDFVKISPLFMDEQNKPAANVEDIFPRRSKISRILSEGEFKEQVLVSNLDYVFIVTSVNDDFSINRLQRYTLLAERGRVTPVIILSKIDLVKTTKPFLDTIKDRLGPIDILEISSSQHLGLNLLLEFMKPRITAAFVGSSGVGKSTIVNSLMENYVQKTLAIRKEDSKGRHTTTSRKLFFLPTGGMIIDTPGLREVQIIADEDLLAETFQHVSRLINSCKFSDCTHGNEPGCAVVKAIQEEALSTEEYERFLKLKKEALYNEKKINKITASNDKRRWKTIHKNMKARRKFEGKG